MKKIISLFIVTLLSISIFSGNVSAGFFSDVFDSSGPQNPICQWDNECWVNAWIDAVKWSLDASETEKPASEYIQDIISYVLTFTAIVWVIYIIYAGFNILTAAGDEDKVSKSKTTIIYVAVWLVVMFLAASIIGFIFGIFDWASTPNQDLPPLDYQS